MIGSCSEWKVGMVALCFDVYSVYGSSQVKTSLLDNARRKNARLVVRDRGIDRGENVTEKTS